MLLVVAWLLVGGLGLPVPEDPGLIAAGALAHRPFDLALALGITLIAVVVGDVTLFGLARCYGDGLARRWPFRRLLSPRTHARLTDAYRRHGGKIVFFARHLTGLRAAAFVMAGMHGMALKRFFWWDALGACVSVPPVVILGYLGARHATQLHDDLAAAHQVLLIVAVMIVVGVVAFTWRRSTRGESRCVERKHRDRIEKVGLRE